MRKYFWSIVLGLLLLVGLWIISLQNYLLFHGLAEIFSIVVAFSIFILAWNSCHFVKNSYLLFIGIAYLFVGGLDLTHTLAYKGMGIFSGDEANSSTQLWILTRYVESISLLIASFFIGRKLKTSFAFIGYILIISVMLGSIFYWNLFPVCFVEGEGLTTFKKASEYIISFILIASIIALLKKQNEIEKSVLQLLIASIVVTVASELAFTLYTDVYGFLNLLGHYLKIISFYLIYLAIIKTGLTKPYALFARDIKQSEEELLIKNEAIASSITAIGITDLDGKLVYVNNALVKMWGYDNNEEILGRFLPEFWEGDGVFETIKILREKGVRIGEDIGKRKDGSLFHVLFSASMIKDKTGSPVFMFGSFVDINERKQAEEELRKLENDKAVILNSTTEIIAFHDLNHNIQWVNKAYLKATGLSLSDVKGRKCFHVWGLDRPCTNCPVSKVIETGEAHEAELTPQNQEHWPANQGCWMVRAAPVKDNDGSIVGAIEVAYDISKRKRVENELEETRKNLAKAQEIAHIGSWRLDIVKNHLWWSDEIYRIFGIPQNTPMSYEKFIEYVYPEDRAYVHEQWLAALNKKPYNIEHRIVAAGAIKWVCEQAEVTFDEAGNAVSGVGTVQDITERKRVEHKVLESEQKFKTLITNIPDVIWTTDFNGNTTFISSNIQSIYGYSPEEIYARSGELWLNRIHHEEVEDVKRAFGALFETGVPFDIEYRIQRKNGDWIWLHDRSFTTYQKDGIMYADGILTDITERKQAEEKLAKSEERFRSLMEQSPLAIEILTPEGQISKVNNAWMRLWGFNKEDTTQVLAKYNMLTDKQTVDLGIASLIRKAFKGQPVVLPAIKYVSERTTKDIGLQKIKGASPWIQCHLFPVKDANQEIMYVVNTYLNITERIQSELQIREMASFAELNPAPVLRVNPDGIIMSCNPASVEILGKNAKKGTSIVSLMSDFSKVDLNKCIQNNLLISQEVDLKGRFYLFILRGVSDLKLLHIYGSDITELKKTEVEVQQLKNEYAHIARVSAMGELTASLAHELKQPLAAMRTNAQAAQRFLTADKPDIDELHEILKDIINDNRRADDVIKKLRALMQKKELRITRLNINEVIRDILPLINSYEIARNISLEFKLDKNISYVNGDRIQLQQVILNLIVNSSEACMDAEQKSSRIVVSTSQNDKDNVTVSVKDNGPGIDDTVMRSLFEPFYTTKKEGLGMGLAISRSIIDGHKGRLWAENNDDHGTTFYFTIPIAKENQA